MPRRSFGRALVPAVIVALLAVVPAFADTVTADGDLVTAGTQNTVFLGQVAPGATVATDVAFTLVCANGFHADAGQIVAVTAGTTTTPAEGGAITATDATIGPVPDTWTVDGSDCAGTTTLAATEPSHVTITAPSVPGTGYAYSILFGKSVSPSGAYDSKSVNGTTAVTFTLDVVDTVEAPPDTTAPTFDTTPSDIDVTTTDPSGTTVHFSTPSASDDSGAAPDVTCAPASGFHAPVGATTVTCTASDGSGNTATTGFEIRVHLASTAWDEPIGAAAAISVNSGRTIPVKARATLDGVDPTGHGTLVIWACAGGVERTVEARWDASAGRWMALLDTSGLAQGCHYVSLAVDGLVFGSFRLDVDPSSSASPTRTRTGKG
jgi:hypothetical protein